MFKSKVGRIIIVTLSVCVIIILGWSLGDVLADQFRDRSREWERVEMQEAILERMNTIHVGDTLLVGNFTNLSGNEMKLSTADNHPLLITFIRPDCGQCKSEIDLIRTLDAQEVVRSRHIFLSDGLAYDFTASTEFTTVLERIWLDNEATYFSAYEMYVTPFNVLVDSDFRIREIYVGTPTKEKLETWYEFISVD